MATEPDLPAPIVTPPVLLDEATAKRRPVLLDEATAKRRLAIYTLVRLAGLAALFGGVWLAQHGLGVVTVVLVLIGAASLFVRPKILAQVFGSRW